MNDALQRVHSKRGTFRADAELTSLILANQEELLQAVEDLSLHERCCLAAETGLSLDDALALDVNTLDLAFFHRKAIRTRNLFRASLGPKALLRFGVLHAHQLRDLGCDALDFVAFPMIVHEATAAYGPSACREVWLATSTDAIMLSGSDAACAFEATLERMLELCVALPIAAMEVLRQHPSAGLAVRAVPAATVLATCIVASQLAAVGVLLNDVMAAKYSPAQLSVLGYTAFRL